MVRMPAKPIVKTSNTEAQFTTLLMKRQYENAADLNKALAELMLRLEKETRNIADDTTNIGGYHSDSKLMSRPEPEIAVLRDMVGEATREFIAKFIEDNCSAQIPDMKVRLWGWGINMREGDVNTQHIHPDAKVSGVYY